MVASGDEEKDIVANGGAPNGHFLHCLGNSNGHSMTLSPEQEFNTHKQVAVGFYASVLPEAR